MPNGGAGHCGGCLYNLALLGEFLIDSKWSIKPGFCTLRKVIIPDVGYTFCDNCKYDDFGGEEREKQIQIVLSSEKILGSIWTSDNSGWEQEPHNRTNWSIQEWKKWNKFVLDKFPELRKVKLFSGIDSSKFWWK